MWSMPLGLCWIQFVLYTGDHDKPHGYSEFSEVTCDTPLSRCLVYKLITPNLCPASAVGYTVRPLTCPKTVRLLLASASYPLTTVLGTHLLSFLSGRLLFTLQDPVHHALAITATPSLTVSLWTFSPWVAFLPLAVTEDGAQRGTV